MDNAVGGLIQDYASQLASMDPYGPPKQAEAITRKATALADKTKRAGASAPDLDSEVAKAKAEAKPAGGDDTPNLLADLRAKYPQYKDVPDDKLADGLYAKYYAGKMTREEFDTKVGHKGNPAFLEVDMGSGDAARKPAAQAGKFAPVPSATDSLKRAGSAFLRGLTGGAKSIASGEPVQEYYDAIGKPNPITGGNLRRPEEISASEKLGTLTQGVLPAGAGAVPRAASGAVKAAKGAKEAIGEASSTLTGSAAKQALGDIRTDVSGRAATAAGSEEKTASAAGQRATELQGQRDQLRTQQPVVAAERAGAATAPPKQGQTAGLESERVLAKTRERTAQLERDYVDAGQTREQAKLLAGEKAAQVEEADAAAKRVDEQLMAQPGISKEEFGTTLEKAVRDTNEKYTKIRAKESGYGDALASAGTELRVKTGDIRDEIDRIIKEDIRNPTTRKQLEALKRELSNAVEGAEGAVAEDGLSVKQADSLRKTINEALAKEVYAGDAVSKEAATHLKQIGKMVTREATEAWPAYKEALAKYSTLSRPLEFISSNPLLRKVVVSNPAAAEAVVTRSQIVGKLLTDANKADRKALARLMTESPELRDAARLHFTEKLFGPEGAKAVKSEAGMRTWLAQNKSALDQLGLYGEFKDIRAAKQTAQRAIDKAAGLAKESKKTVAEATQREAEIQKRLKAQQSLRDAARKRVEGQRATVPSAEELKARAAKRAAEGGQRLEKRQGEATKTQETAAARADRYRQFETELKNVSDKELIPKTKSFIAKLRSDGRIDDARYATLLKQVEAAETKLSDSKALRKKLLKIGGVAVLLGGGYKLYRGAASLVGG